MGFEIVSTGVFGARLLNPGFASIHKNGTITFTNADLINRSITSSTDVAMLADKLTGRIAFRKARDGEPSRRLKVSKSKRTAQMGASSVIRAAGREIKDVNKRHPVTVKDDMLIIQL